VHTVQEHLAVVKKPYLQAILEGRKRVELRLTRRAVAPYRAINPGDVIWFKISAGPVAARARTGKVKFLDHLTPETIRKLRDQCQQYVLATDEFWRSRLDCRYATLIRLDEVTVTEQFKPNLSLRKAWLVLNKPLVHDDRFGPL